MTEGRCFLHGSEDDWEAGGMVQRQGKTPFFSTEAAAPSQQTLHSLGSGSNTGNGSSFFLQPQPPTPNVRLTPNLAKAGFNVPGNLGVLFTMDF